MNDLKGNVIDQRIKDSHSVEVNGSGKFAGHRFLLKTRLYGDKRCIYCGRWFHWKDSGMFTWISTRNIDTMNKDGALEPLHCANEHCQEYHRRYLIHQDKLKRECEAKREILYFDMFKNLKKQGVIR